MIIFLLVLDILIYNFTAYNSFFFLNLLPLSKRNDSFKILLLGLFLDFIILDKLFINTFFLLLLLFLNKKFFSVKTKNIIDFLLINNFNFIMYNLFLSIINCNFNILIFTQSLLINIIFAVLSYNILKKRIKLSR